MRTTLQLLLLFVAYLQKKYPQITQSLFLRVKHYEKNGGSKVRFANQISSENFSLFCKEARQFTRQHERKIWIDVSDCSIIMGFNDIPCTFPILREFVDELNENFHGAAKFSFVEALDERRSEVKFVELIDNIVHVKFLDYAKKFIQQTPQIIFA